MAVKRLADIPQGCEPRDNTQFEGILAIFWFRYIASLPIVLGLLAVSLVEVARSAWQANPFVPAGVLTALDSVGRPGQSPALEGRLLPFQPGLSAEQRIVYYVTPDGQCHMSRTWEGGGFGLRLPPAAVAGVRSVEFRLSPESSFGPLRAVGRLFVLDPRSPAAAIDLEGIRRFGRYQFRSDLRDWLVELLNGRQPVYLADVPLTQYSDLKDELRSAGWPDGPLLVWRTTPQFRPTGPAAVAADLLRSLNVDLAVLSEMPDNQSAFRQPAANGRIEVIGWPAE